MAYDQHRLVLRGLFENNDPKKHILTMRNVKADISNFCQFVINYCYLVSADNEACKFGVHCV